MITLVSLDKFIYLYKEEINLDLINLNTHDTLYIFMHLKGEVSIIYGILISIRVLSTPNKV